MLEKMEDEEIETVTRDSSSKGFAVRRSSKREERGDLEQSFGYEDGK